jgi:hypothetical protein
LDSVYLLLGVTLVEEFPIGQDQLTALNLAQLISMRKFITPVLHADDLICVVLFIGHGQDSSVI